MSKNEGNMETGLNPITTIVSKWFVDNPSTCAITDCQSKVYAWKVMTGRVDEALAIERFADEVKAIFLVNLSNNIFSEECVMDIIVEYVYSQIDFKALARHFLQSNMVQAKN